MLVTLNMNTKNKRITIVIVEFIVVELLSFLTQRFLMIKTKNMTLKNIIDNAIIIGTILVVIAIIIQVIYWYISSLNRKFKEQDVRNKFYDIMLLKFEDTYKTHSCRVLEDDLNLFSDKEIKYLNKYLDKKEEFRVEMKGKNKEFGAFMN